MASIRVVSPYCFGKTVVPAHLPLLKRRSVVSIWSSPDPLIEEITSILEDRDFNTDVGVTQNLGELSQFRFIPLKNQEWPPMM